MGQRHIKLIFTVILGNFVYDLYVGGDPWAAPDGWNALHPPLHLNLDDQMHGYVLNSGAMHVTTDVFVFFLCCIAFVQLDELTEFI